ncbi:hypothetical protein VTN77DRAFT_2198 [Rasamsonia byssochlamydoides]|uniref:uncharacterized protein n=1 Tax=Rasamsonia byssochlamydoides TaxID=89139 RepID=UPI003743B687
MANSVVFTPALGQTVVVPAGTSVVIYASSPTPVELTAKIAGQDEQIPFTQVQLDSIGQESLLTYKLGFFLNSGHQDIVIFDNGRELGKISFVQIQATGVNQEFVTEILLEEGDEWKSQRLDWLNVHDWEGWAWYRPRETWIEASFTHLSQLSPETPTHNLLLRPASAEIDPRSVLAVFPASSREAFVTLSAARNGDPPGVYARVRRIKKGGPIKVYVTGKLTVHKGTTTAIRSAVKIARAKYGLSSTTFINNSSPNPFDRLGFCTWTSIGENVPLTIDLIDNLVQLLRRDNVPVGTFLIDDGWQDIRRGQNGAEKTRGLWSFGTWDGMKSSLAETVNLIKRTLPTVKDLGVWMTLAGYWNSIVPDSPLARKYEMRVYHLDRDNVRGIHWPTQDFDGQQSGSISRPENRVWCLPPPHQAYAFWRDYFRTCAEAGITFVKVDNQAYGSFLQGVDGGEEFVALWDGVTRAANETFGENRVIHCMAHYERMFNGDIGMGAATQGKRIVIRNSDDFGLPRRNVHRDHIRYNIFNGMLLSHQCLTLDTDMFMTSAQWPEYHAVLRAFFNGPIFLADKPGAGDPRVRSKLIGRAPDDDSYQVVRAPTVIRPLRRNVWERFLDAGRGASLKGTSYFPESESAAIVLWNTREDGVDHSVDVLFEGDLLDALDKSTDRLSGAWEGVIWAANARKAKSVRLDPALASSSDWQTISSEPVVAASLAPQTAETVTVAPYHTVGTARIANLGLVDKYASLAGIASSRVDDNRLLTEIKFDGVVGFVVAGDVTAGDIKVTVDGNALGILTEPLGELTLVQVDLSKTARTGSSGSIERSTWMVEIRIEKS